MFPRFSQHLLACILSQYLNSLHPAPLSCFRHSFLDPKNSPCVSQHFFACIFMHLHLVSCLGFTPHLSKTFCAHPVSISNFPFPLCHVPFNFLHPCRFIRRLPPLASPPLLTFFVSISELPRHQQLFACILCVYVCMYACVHVCMYACMHVCMYACMHVRTYVRTYVCMYRSIDLFIYLSV